MQDHLIITGAAIYRLYYLSPLIHDERRIVQYMNAFKMRAILVHENPAN